MLTVLVAYICLFTALHQLICIKILHEEHICYPQLTMKCKMLKYFSSKSQLESLWLKVHPLICLCLKHTLAKKENSRRNRKQQGGRGNHSFSDFPVSPEFLLLLRKIIHCIELHMDLCCIQQKASKPISEKLAWSPSSQSLFMWKL